MPQRAESSTIRNRLARRLVVALVLAAAAVSPALAGAGDRPRTTARSAQVTVVEQDGFDWADAGIGALGAFGAMFVAVGVALVVRYGRGHPVAVLSGTGRPAVVVAARRAKRKRRLS